MLAGDVIFWPTRTQRTKLYQSCNTAVNANPLKLILRDRKLPALVNKTQCKSSRRELSMGLLTLHFCISCPSWAKDLTPYEQARQLIYGPTSEGDIRSCPSNVNPNCVSTKSNNDSYAPAWRATERTSVEAAKVLEEVVALTLPDAELVQSRAVAAGQYLAFTVPSSFGRDVFEFVIKDIGVTDRGWAGDVEGALVTYRSMAGSVKYVWPIQLPISDFGLQRQRMEELRKALGWSLIGCEMIECYEFESHWL